MSVKYWLPVPVFYFWRKLYITHLAARSLCLFSILFKYERYHNLYFVQLQCNWVPIIYAQYLYWYWYLKVRYWYLYWYLDYWCWYLFVEYLIQDWLLVLFPCRFNRHLIFTSSITIGIACSTLIKLCWHKTMQIVVKEEYATILPLTRWFYMLCLRLRLCSVQ